MSNEAPFHILRLSKDGEVQDIPYNIDYEPDLFKSKASYGFNNERRFENLEGNISVKSDFNRLDYESFRAKTIGLNPIDEMLIAEKAYKKVGMVKNIIDMMAEFTSQGVRVEHENAKKQRFLEEWFTYINGYHVSERLVHMLYRLGAAPVQTAFGYISKPTENKMSAVGQFGDIDYKPLEIEKKKIPLKYTFIPPWSIEIIGGDLSLFIDEPFYAVKIPTTITSALAGKAAKVGDKDLQSEVKKALTKIKQITKGNTNYIYLDPERFDIYFYKKDDWQAWPSPMISSIIDDLMLLEKMKLADSSSLDGAISNIRHWTVGIIDPSNPVNNILPTKAGINRIRQILSMSVAGGTMDLVTGPEVKFTESNTQIHKFLGTEKYESTLNAIYDGLGIPPPLRSNNSTNATNNYISLKTLIERLEYGRNILTTFWNKQLEIVQKALGHSSPGKIVFDTMILSDESAEKKLLIELLDRDIVDPESVQKYFGFTPSLIQSKLKKHVKSRDNNISPPKAGPFHTAQQDFEHKKALLQNGDIAPSEIGIELKPKKDGEESRIDKLGKQKIKEAKLKPKPTSTKPKKGSKGRPKSVKETQKRKKKPNFKPRTGKAYRDLLLWSTNAFNYVSEKLSPIILSSFGKKNFRQLTIKQFEEAEQFKFRVFSQLEALSQLTEINLYASLEAKSHFSHNIIEKYNKLKSNYMKENNKEPTAEENRQLYILSYVEEKYEGFEEKGE